MTGKARTMREVYELTDVLNKITGSTPLPERLLRRERILQTVFDGVALGDQPQVLRSSAIGETHYEKGLGERNALAHVLVGTNLSAEIVEVAQLQPPSPDFRLTLADGCRPYVELAQIAPTDRLVVQGAVSNITKALEAARASDAVLASAIAGRYIEVTFQRFPLQRNYQITAANEIVAYVKAIDLELAAQMRLIDVPAQYPVLHDLEAQVALARSRGSTHLGVRVPSTIGMPEGVVDSIIANIANKRDKIVAYGIGLEKLWLALAINDIVTPANWSFSEIRKRLPEIVVEPFDRVIVGCADGGFVIERDTNANVRFVTISRDEFIERDGTDDFAALSGLMGE
jgi:hypothetical protein